MKNLNLLFNKTYYEKVGMHGKKATKDFQDELKKNNVSLFGYVFSSKDYVALPMQCHSLLMKTTYPGMLIGTGYSHGTGLEDADADIAVGFSFDYVSGQPYIPGSSVKGLLRSVFAHAEIVKERFDINEDGVKELEKSIFGTIEREDAGVDVFFDAVLRKGDGKGKVVGSDTITPHGKNKMKNPIPIQIIKVLPDVVFEFRFLLQDSVLTCGKIITADEKLGFFRDMLELFGIGAKTNVGYGALVPCTAEEIARTPEPEAAPKEETRTAQNHTVQNLSAQNRPIQGQTDGQLPVRRAVDGKIEVGETYSGRVTGIQSYGAFVEIDGARRSGLVHISKIAHVRVDNVGDYVSKGQRVYVKVLSITQDKIALSIKDAKP